MQKSLVERVSAPQVKSFVNEIVQRVPPNLDVDRKFVEKFFERADRIALNMASLRPGRNGCVVGVAEVGEGKYDGYWELREVGDDSGGNLQSENELERNKVDKHTAFAVAKMSVLFGHKTFTQSSENVGLDDGDKLLISDDKSTWVVPGGAFRIGDKLVVCSGYPEAADDEAFALAMMVACDEISMENAITIARDVLHNQIFGQIVDDLLK